MLLKKYNKKDASNYFDLENKLMQLYAEKPTEIEKEFANIHPHKELILKHFSAPKEEITLAPVTISGDDSQVIKERVSAYSNCEGCGGTCGKSNYDGVTSFPNSNDSRKSDMLGIIAIVGIIAMVGVILKK
jgi:hypothetical protein